MPGLLNYQKMSCVCFFLCGLASEINAMLCVEQLLLRKQLRFGFSGKVSEAKCSSEADAKRIQSELSGFEQQVDEAVEVLISWGMSTKYVREAKGMGLDLSKMGMQYDVIAYGFWTLWFCAELLLWYVPEVPPMPRLWWFRPMLTCT